MDDCTGTCGAVAYLLHIVTNYRIAGKFGMELNLVVFRYICLSTAKLNKICQFCSVCMYVWQYHTIPPNLNLPIVLFGAKPPKLMTANISGYTVLVKCLKLSYMAILS